MLHAAQTAFKPVNRTPTTTVTAREWQA